MAASVIQRALAVGTAALRPRGCAILVSRCCQDSAADAGRLRDYLDQRFGEGSVAMQDRDAESAHDVAHAVHAARVVVAMVGPHWLKRGKDAACVASCPARAEIAESLRTRRIVVPIMVGAATFPDHLPKDLIAVTRYQAYLVYDTHISGQLSLPGEIVASVLSRRPKRNRLIRAAIGVCVILLAVAFGVAS